tara:strand:- start:288 stop:740 length:453 start_codon:yes stop_codon:yes gene_type:complete
MSHWYQFNIESKVIINKLKEAGISTSFFIYSLNIDFAKKVLLNCQFPLCILGDAVLIPSNIEMSNIEMSHLDAHDKNIQASMSGQEYQGYVFIQNLDTDQCFPLKIANINFDNPGDAYHEVWEKAVQEGLVLSKDKNSYVSCLAIISLNS